MIVAILVNDLQELIKDVGRDGGLMSPSIYDTAQILRIHPHGDDIWPVVNWLLAQQHPDGGWGDPSMPLRRVVPTLAALLALRAYCTRRTAINALEQAKIFLRRQLHYWSKPTPDDLPAWMDVVWPYMLEQAVAEHHADNALVRKPSVTIDISPLPYGHFVASGNRKRNTIRASNPTKGTPPFYAWEAWGGEPVSHIVDATGGVGHSPAATATWLQKAMNDPMASPQAINGAQEYLARAAVATSEKTPGLYPTAWPIPRFEQSLSLYALMIGGILGFAPLHDVLKPQLHDLYAALTPTGIGLSDAMIADGDTTLAALAVFFAAGLSADHSLVDQFVPRDGGAAADGSQPSIMLTARAIHALTHAGHDVSGLWQTCLQLQHRDGTWSGDHGNISWLYATAHAMIALKNSPFTGALREAIDALRVYQFANGGWGIIGRPTTVETAYAVLALHSLRSTGILTPEDMTMLYRGYDWLLTHYRPFRMKDYQCWSMKEIYCPQRIDRAYELSALLAVTLEPRPA